MTYPFRTLPDHLARGLQLVCVGINPGLYSGDRGTTLRGLGAASGPRQEDLMSVVRCEGAQGNGDVAWETYA